MAERKDSTLDSLPRVRAWAIALAEYRLLQAELLKCQTTWLFYPRNLLHGEISLYYSAHWLANRFPSLWAEVPGLRVAAAMEYLQDVVRGGSWTAMYALLEQIERNIRRQPAVRLNADSAALDEHSALGYIHMPLDVSLLRSKAEILSAFETLLDPILLKASSSAATPPSPGGRPPSYEHQVELYNAFVDFCHGQGESALEDIAVQQAFLRAISRTRDRLLVPKAWPGLTPTQVPSRTMAKTMFDGAHGWLPPRRLKHSLKQHLALAAKRGANETRHADEVVPL